MYERFPFSSFEVFSFNFIPIVIWPSDIDLSIQAKNFGPSEDAARPSTYGASSLKAAGGASRYESAVPRELFPSKIV